MKKILAMLFFGMFLSASSAFATTVYLTGSVDSLNGYETANTGITLDSPVSLELEWLFEPSNHNDFDVEFFSGTESQSGIEFTWTNYLTLSVGDVIISETIDDSQIRPEAQFSLGILDNISLNYIDYEMVGATGGDIWEVLLQADPGTGVLSFSIRDDDAGASDWISGSLEAHVCDSGHLLNCITSTGCYLAGGDWVDGTCIAAVCDAEHMDLCSTEGECSGAVGYWYEGHCDSSPTCDPDYLHYCLESLDCRSAGGYWYNSQCNMYSTPSSDFGADGMADILLSLRHSGRGQLWLYEMDGNTIAASNNIGGLSTDWEIAAVADLGGDGKADILLRHSVRGQLWLFEMDGNTIAASNNIGGLSPIWDVEDVADFDGDGKEDILLRHSDRGQLWLYEMDGHVVDASNNIGGLSPIWDVAMVSDFGGDGKADILLRHSTRGQLWLYEMDGPVIDSSNNVGGLNLNWNTAD